LELAEICREVNLPPGVLNVVTGLGNDAGAPLASHPDVDKVLILILILILFLSSIVKVLSMILAR